MKRFWIALLGAGLFATAAFAGGDEVPVRMHELPDAAKTLVKKYFHDIEVVSATMEKGVAPSYEVKLADGTKIDFDARGEWTDVERPGGCRARRADSAADPEIRGCKLSGAARPGCRTRRPQP